MTETLICCAVGQEVSLLSGGDAGRANLLDVLPSGSSTTISYLPPKIPQSPWSSDGDRGDSIGSK